MRADFKLTFTERIMGSDKKRFLGGGEEGGRLIASEKLVKVYLLQRIQ